MRKAGLPKVEIDAFIKEATSGDTLAALILRRRSGRRPLQ